MFKEALKKSALQLLKLKEIDAISNFALIGGIALSSYLEPRATADIDYAILLHKTELHEVAAKLKADARKGDIYDPLAGIINYSVKWRQQAVPVQIIQFHPRIEDVIFENITILRFEDVPIPIVNPRGLIILKLYAGGPIDMEDARQLLALKELKKVDRMYIEGHAKALRILSRLKQALN